MHKEVVKREGNTVLLIVGIIVLVFISMSILDSVMMSTYTIIVDLAAVMLITVLAYMVLRYKIIDYKYVLIDSDLIFYRILRNNEEVLLNVNIDDIIIVAPAGNKTLKAYSKVNKVYNLCGSFFTKDKYYGIFQKDGMNYKFSFEPSEKLIKLLKRSIPDKVA